MPALKGTRMDCQVIRVQEIVWKYLAEELPEEEVQAFEKHYFECDACFEHLQLEHAAAVQLRKTEPAAIQKRKLRIFSYRAAVAAAAAFVFLALLPLYFWLSSGTGQERSIEQILANLAAVEEAPPFPDVLLRAGGGPSLNDAEERAKRHYQAGRFREAAAEFETILASDPANAQTSFYLGVSLLMTDDAERAAAAFERALEQGGGAFRELSHWHLAKAYLRLGEMEEFERELEAVAGLGGSYQRQAREALEALEGARLN
jgi:tetratricopeptide (TPR) repeat protein